MNAPRLLGIDRGGNSCRPRLGTIAGAPLGDGTGGAANRRLR
jgi:N-acetylglucosamine kinase-like BadF-type ATPase